MPQKYVTILAQQYHQYENDNAHIPAQDMGKYKQALRLIYG